MHAIVVKDGAAHLLDVPTPVPQPDQALIRIRRAGICNTDLEVIAGYKQFSGILGHEFVGEVVDCEALPQLVGQRVVGEISVTCGECDFCRRGIPSQCRNRTTVGINRHDGGFAEYLALDARCLHIVPGSVSDDQAVFTEPLAAALQLFDRSHTRPRDRVVVIGAGKLGLLCAQVLHLAGVDLTVITRRPRVAELLAKWGIASAQLESLENASFQVAVECTGNSHGFESALNLLEPRGTLILKSTYVGLPEADLTRVVVNELTLVGNRCGPFEAALRLLSGGLVDVEGMIDARYPITEGESALRDAAQPGRLKVLLDFPA